MINFFSKSIYDFFPDERISYSDWSSWSECSQTCGKGEKSRVRKCNPSKKNKTIVCFKEDTKVKSFCNAKPCPSKYLYILLIMIVMF